MAIFFEDLRDLPIGKLRHHIRHCHYTGQTAGLGCNLLQANLAILPESFALDFMRFCQRNPKPCPLVGVSDTGNPRLHTLGEDLDVRTDVPSYFVYKNGELTKTETDITPLWQDDFVAFALGCSFTFEHTLQAAGFELWHITNTTTVPMFRSNIATVPAGVFGGEMVVSMRAIPEERLQEVQEISAQFPMAHGTPIHIGDPSKIGIQDLTSPDWGSPVPIPNDAVPVFWACGVTPQVAIMRAKLPICISHKPGHMLITDIADRTETTTQFPRERCISV